MTYMYCSLQNNFKINVTIQRVQKFICENSKNLPLIFLGG